MAEAGIDQDAVRAHDVGATKVGGATPAPHLRSRVHDGVAASHGIVDRIRVGNVAPSRVDPGG